MQGACRPMGGGRHPFLKISKNGIYFLNFVFFNIKNKISKIYTVFRNFQKWVSAAPLATGPLHGPVAHPGGDRDPFVIKIFTTRLLETYL